MKKTVIKISLLLVILITACSKQEPTEVKMISPEEMNSLLELEDIQLIDVRTPEEYEIGHVEFAQNIDFNSPTFEEDILSLDKSKPVILYCHAGGRSAKCAKKLAEAGFVKIYDLQGGITQWEFKGFEITTDE